MHGKARKGRDLCYVYALTDRGVRRRLHTRPRTLRTLDIGDVAVIFDSRRDLPSVTAENLREQHAIVRQLANGMDALLPVRFGTLAPRVELEARVGAAHALIRRALDRVRGRVQMSVRMYSTSAPESRRATASSGTAYLRALAERDRKVRRQAARIARAVSRLVVEQHIEQEKGRVHAAMYHLIDAEDVDLYREALAKLAPSLAPDRIVVTGPWPVFAFAPDLGRG